MAKIFIDKEIINKFQVPNLPVPSLEETAKIMEDWFEPFAQVEKLNFEDIKKDINDFIDSKDIQEAQKFLQEKSNNKNGSYLIDWWHDSYLNYQGVNLNIAAGFTWTNENISNMTQIEKAALFMWTISKFYLEYKTNYEDWQILKTKKNIFSLDQLNGLFSSYRKMNNKSDDYHIKFGISEHILFMYKNAPYLVQTIKNNQLVSLGSIIEQVQKIIDNFEVSHQTIVNYFELTNDRNKYSNIYNQILKNNKDSYEKMSSAIFVIGYDVSNILSKEDAIKTFSQGGGQLINRWIGKSINFGVNKSSHFVITMEHTYYDGGALIQLMDFIDQEITKINFNDKSIKSSYKLLNFNISSEEKDIALKIRDKYLDFSNKIIFKGLDIPYGRLKLKELGIKSLDGFFQLVGQLAQQKTWDTMYSTYEAVDMRSYFKGRTECIRPLSNSILNFANAYFEKDFSNIKELMSKVEDEHYLKAKSCKLGKGVHRHLLGLELACKTLGITNKLPIIDSDYYKKFASNRMSTSTVGHKGISQFAFWPVQSDGFTMGYKIGDESIFITSTSMLENKNLLFEYLNNFQQIFETIYHELKK